MAKDRRFLPANLADDATFRTWVQGIEAQILAMGLALASDTGQLDPTTALRPAVNTYAGFRMYRFADALQATKPVFIKVEYGSGITLGYPGTRWTVSTATNGAGTATGNVVGPFVASLTSKAAGVTLESFASGSTSRLNLVTHLDPTSGNFSLMALIERTVDPDGAPNANGVLVHWAANANPSTYFQMLPFQGAMTTPLFGTSNTNSPWPSAGATFGHQMSDGLNVALLPLVVACAGKASLATFLRYVHTDIGELVTITLPHLGATRTFLPMGDGGVAVAATTLNMTNAALALLWE